MTGRTRVPVPGFRAVPDGTQERPGRGAAFPPFRGENWSHGETIVSDSCVPNQERLGQEREKAKGSAALRFLIPDVPKKSSGTLLLRNINMLATVPGFLPSLKRGGGFRNRPSHVMKGERMGARTTNRSRRLRRNARGGLPMASGLPR